MTKWILVIFYTLFLVSCSIPYNKSDHCNGKQFHNLIPPADPNLKKNCFYLKELLKNKSEIWPDHVKNTDIPKLPNQINRNEIYITHINHSTELIQLQAFNIITDPIFSKRASPFSWMGPKRVRDPGIAFERLPKIDIVLISHNHYDHFDIESLKKLNKIHHPLFIIPLNDAALLNKAGIKHFIEMDWWQSYRIAPNYTITFIPAQHWSTRNLFDINSSLWGGYVIHADDLKILFTGDTGYGSHIQQIHDRLGKMDICFLPIGCYDFHKAEAYNHFNPEEAVKAHILLGSKLSIGMHFGTFQLSEEKYNEPVERLNSALEEFHVNPQDFIAPGNGRTLYFSANTLMEH